MTEFQNNQIERMILLEYLGIQLDDTKEVPSKDGTTIQYGFYFSVPSSSTLTMPGFEEDITTAEGLMKIGKRQLLEIFEEAWGLVRDICEDEVSDEDWADVVRNKCIFYAKVREDDVWDLEKAKAAVEELRDAIKESNGYREI